MKNIVLVLLMLLLMSATAVTVTKMSDRSKEQKIMMGKDLNQIKTQIQTNYYLGYRVVSMVSQDQQIMVVMEK